MCDTCGCNITKGNGHTEAGQTAVDVMEEIPVNIVIFIWY